MTFYQIFGTFATVLGCFVSWACIKAYIEYLLEHEIQKKYFIGKNDEGHFYIYAKKFGVKGAPRELTRKTKESGQEVRQPIYFANNAEAHAALTEFLKKHIDSKSKKEHKEEVDVREILVGIEMKETQVRLQALIDEADNIKKKEREEREQAIKATKKQADDLSEESKKQPRSRIRIEE